MSAPIRTQQRTQSRPEDRATLPLFALVVAAIVLSLASAARP